MKCVRLFKKEIENPQSSFTTIDVPESKVGPDGEVKFENAPMWNQFAYSCTHCKLKYESLDNLLKHFRTDVTFDKQIKFTIKCTICWVGSS